jgi:DNA-directed RNA polymerase subunit RPC12/RpoP
MIGICIELKTACKHCSSPLMLNAFTEEFLCRSCNKINSIPQETWKSLLSDALEEAPGFEPGDGQPSTVMTGEYSFNLMYGRLEPRCGKCKENIDTSKMEEYGDQKIIKCTKCGNALFIRKPSELVTTCFPAVKYLVGEDDNLMSQNKAGAALPAAAKPVLFTCPSCTGNLEIDGKDRMVDCKFCGSQIYLPDDLWFRLHPARSVERWYMLVGEGESSVAVSGTPMWEDFGDVTIDEQGNLYICGDNLTVWAVGPDLKTRWVKSDLMIDHEGTGLAMAHDGNLYLWNVGKRSLLKISSKDGATLKKIEGKAPSKEDPYPFSMKGCGALASDRDGTILALIHNTVVRYNTEGERLQLWKGKKLGLFSSGVGKEVPEDGPPSAPYVKEMGSCPKLVNSEYTRLNMGWDGYLYFMDKSSADAELAKYSGDGKQLWSRPIPLDSKEGKPWADADGNVYILGTTEKSHTHLVRYSPATKKFETLLTDVVEGGVLHDEEHLAVSREGRIFVLEDYSRMKVFSTRLEMIYRSKKSEENDDESLEEMKKEIEKEKDLS